MAEYKRIVAKLRCVKGSLFCIKGSLNSFIPNNPKMLDALRNFEPGTPLLLWVRKIEGLPIFKVLRFRLDVFTQMGGDRSARYSAIAEMNNLTLERQAGRRKMRKGGVQSSLGCTLRKIKRQRPIKEVNDE